MIVINLADTKAPAPMGWPTSPEWVADFDWKWWPASIGIPGRHRRNPQLCINGHEYAKRQLAKEGMG